MKRLVVACLLLFALSAPSSCAQHEARGSSLEVFQKFWSEFREAALAGNKEKIASLTEFPFETRGQLDESRVMKHDRASFLSILDKLLDQDTGLSPEPEPMRRLIGRMTRMTAKELGDDGQTARVGGFVFQRIKDRWVFTMAYVEE